jgi:hypothetical protein
MAYRNDVDALEARLSAVQRDLDATTRDRDETARMLGEARDRVRNDDLAADYAAGGPQRRRRRRALITGAAAALAVIGGFATYKLTRPSASQRFEQVFAQFTGFETAMCKCTNKQCADSVMDGVNKWATTIAKEQPQKSSQPTEEQMKRMSTVAEQFGQCMTKAMSPPAESQ